MHQPQKPTIPQSTLQEPHYGNPAPFNRFQRGQHCNIVCLVSLLWEKIFFYVLLWYSICFEGEKRTWKVKVVKFACNVGNTENDLKSHSSSKQLNHLRAENSYPPYLPRQSLLSFSLAPNIQGEIKRIQINLFLRLICQSTSITYRCTKVAGKTWFVHTAFWQCSQGSGIYASLNLT